MSHFTQSNNTSPQTAPQYNDFDVTFSGEPSVPQAEPQSTFEYPSLDLDEQSWEFQVESSDLAFTSLPDLPPADDLFGSLSEYGFAGLPELTPGDDQVLAPVNDIQGQWTDNWAESDLPVDPNSFDYSEGASIDWSLFNSSVLPDAAVPEEAQPGSSAAVPVVVEEGPEVVAATSIAPGSSVSAPLLTEEQRQERLAAMKKRRRSNKPRVQR